MHELDREFLDIAGVRSVPEPLGPWDERTSCFLDLVRCRPSCVQDIPGWTSEAEYRVRAEETLSTANRAAATMAPEYAERREMYFGKHKGKTLAEVPTGYLRWMVGNIKPNDNSMRKTLQAAKAVLRSRTAS